MSDIDEQVQRSFDRDAVRDAVMRLAATCVADGQYDPADDPRGPAVVLALTELLGNVAAQDAAIGIQQALWLIVTQVG